MQSRLKQGFRDLGVDLGVKDVGFGLMLLSSIVSGKKLRVVGDLIRDAGLFGFGVQILGFWGLKNMKVERVSGAKQCILFCDLVGLGCLGFNTTPPT